MHLTTVKLSFSAYSLFVISCFLNAILHVEVVEWEILHSATSGPLNSIGVRANTADSLEIVIFFFSTCLQGSDFMGSTHTTKPEGSSRSEFPGTSEMRGIFLGVELT